VLSKNKKSLKRDTETKFNDYEQHGVGEYWMIDPEAETVEQHLLKDGKYALELKSGEGTIHSREIEGFAIPIRAIFDENENLAVLRKLL
jgi:Uma2 family endonuclease